MKKTLYLILILSMSIALVACGSEVGNELKEPIAELISYEQGAEIEGVFDDAGNISLDYLFKLANEQNQNRFVGPSDYEGIENIMGGQVDGLITEEEISKLKNTKGYDQNQKLEDQSISTDEALADCDLFFRSFEYAYSGYYYYGKDKFDASKEKAEAAIKDKVQASQGKILSSELAQIIFDSLDFFKDGHLYMIGPNTQQWQFFGRNNGRGIETYISMNEVFGLDTTGYYVEQEGERWYFAEENDSTVSVQPVLRNDGTIKFSLVRLLPGDAERISTIILGKGQERKEIEVEWNAFVSYTSDKEIVNRFGEYAYIRYPNFLQKKTNDRLNDPEDYEAGASNVIIDLRGNSGGDEGIGYQMIKHFVNTEPSTTEVFINNNNALTGTAKLGQEEWSKLNEKVGSFTKNDKKVYVLIDKDCASAGEATIRYLTSLENVILIGTNTLGGQLTRPDATLTLPNSKIGFRIGSTATFFKDISDIEAVGIAPLVYADPGMALESLIELLDNKDAKTLLSSANYEESGLKVTFTCDIYNSLPIYNENSGFGRIYSTNKAVIKVNGKRVTDYTISCEDEDDITWFEKKPGGDIIVHVNPRYMKYKLYHLKVNYNGVEYPFNIAQSFEDFDENGNDLSGASQNQGYVPEATISVGKFTDMRTVGSFGAIVGDEVAVVKVDGERITDYTVQCSNSEDAFWVEKIEGGDMMIHAKPDANSVPQYVITVTYGGDQFKFTVYQGEPKKGK